MKNTTKSVCFFKCEGKIALFCKFGFVCQPVRFANVCNVRGLPQLSRRAEAGGQKLIFSCTNFQSMSQYFLSVFSIFIIRFQCSIRSFSLAYNVLAVNSRFNGIYRVLGKVVLCVYLFFKLFNNQIKFVTKYQFCIIVCLIFKEFKEFFFSKTIYKFFHKQSG